MRRLSLPVASLLALLLGALSVFGFAPYNFSLLPVLTLAGWFALLHAYPAARAARYLGFAFGFGYFAAGIGWLYISLNHYGGVPAAFAVLAVALFAAYLGLFPLFAAWCAARIGGAPWLRLLLLPAAFGLAEWLRGWLFTGFPWLSAGYAQIPAGWLSGFAPLFGIYGVTYLVALSAALLVLAVIGSGRSRVLPMLVLLLLWATGALLGRVAWTQPQGAPLSVALLQGNIPQDRKWQESELAATFERYRQLVLAAREQLIVLPETALPIFLHDIPGEYLDALRVHARQRGADVLLGVPALTPDGQQYHNTVTSLGTAPQQMYRKIHLVPFGEFIPFKALLGSVYQLLSIPLTDFAAGDAGQQPILVAGQRLLLNICYEDVFGEELLDRVADTTIMLNVTNDAWYDRSPAAWQHLQISQARALETGRYMLRATNTGMTAIIDQHGHLLKLAPWFTEQSLSGVAQGYRGTTPYVRMGNWPVVAWLSLWLLGGAALARRRS